MGTLPKPQYTIWQGIAAAIALAMRALEEVRTLARLPGPKGDPGPPGPGLQNLKETVEDGGRILIHRYEQGDQVVEFRHVLATVLYRDIYREGVTYERGDMVTWGGAMWHCNAETTDKPGDGSKAWTLAVKKGRDGKDKG